MIIQLDHTPILVRIVCAIIFNNFPFSLDDLEKFIIYATKELSVELGEDDYEGLLQVMRVLNEVKAKQDAGTDTMFEPLRDIIDVLKEYGVDFPEETYEQVIIFETTKNKSTSHSKVIPPFELYQDVFHKK